MPQPLMYCDICWQQPKKALTCETSVREVIFLMGQRFASLGCVPSFVMVQLWNVTFSTPNFVLLALTWMPALLQQQTRGTNYERAHEQNLTMLCIMTFQRPQLANKCRHRHKLLPYYRYIPIHTQYYYQIIYKVLGVVEWPTVSLQQYRCMVSEILFQLLYLSNL